MIEENHPWLAGMLNQTHRRMVSRLPAQESRYLDQPPGLREGISMSRYAAKKIAPKHANRRNLIPVVSDLESLSLLRFPHASGNGDASAFDSAGLYTRRSADRI